jgi:RNA 3'-phosphate cyclase
MERTIDGSFEEGGGQILRTALALSIVTGDTVTVKNIRANRPVPGVKAQHLHTIKTACDLWEMDVTGAEKGSEEVTIKPGPLKQKKAIVDIGTAGSITLLLQGILLPAIHTGKDISLDITGGTDVKWSIPIDFFKNVIVPCLKPIADIDVMIQRRGYFPKGGGRVEIRIKPNQHPQPIDASTKGELLTIKGIAHASSDLELQKVAERMAVGAISKLKRSGMEMTVKTEYSHTLSSGAGIGLWGYFRRTEDMTKGYVLGADQLGERGKPAEKIGEIAASKLLEEIDKTVDSHTADNILPFIAVFGGQISAPNPSKHFQANKFVIETFLGKFSEKNSILSMPKKQA